MQVILTHEQSDFDAIASLLGAALLQKNSFAILPSVLNVNVKNFIRLYDFDLPFTSYEDLPKEPIDFITLVETQSLITLKGVKNNASISVIAHHAKKDHFPADWKFTLVPTSACTTYFVEVLQENNENLTMIQATLLLLGIYEDTGSLTYANTSSRDARAVAFLMDQGASLKIAAEYLNPPLTEGQKSVFENLMTSMETLNIHNCKIFISVASAKNLDDEVSSIAHKIFDLSDPDALFIFVESKEGIRVVARSITDQIDTGEIMRKYGGGGHERAAAALIKRNKQNINQLSDIVTLFKQELPSYVKPTISIRQIMSKNPLTITQSTSAKEAHTLMKNYGYEGYPVIKDGEVIGLLTRRAVDRALSHNLNLPSSSLMEAGKIFVYPDDSLETLQKLMADSGWGQVPVIDKTTKDVVGIVTRTDLLKSIAGKQTGIVEKTNLSADMESNLPPARLGFLKIISLAARKLNLPIYLVGGFARDLILGEMGLDMDFVVEGNAIQLAQTLAEKYGGRVTCHKKFGTAKWHISSIKKDLLDQKDATAEIDYSTLPSTIDLISARTEFYEKPTALPTIKSGNIKLDLHRRDFTINTMAVRLDGSHFGELYDFWGGLADLKDGIIRVLHSLSFVDDPTRILRAVRFEQRFGFKIEGRTLALLYEAKGLLEEVSGDRIRHEIDLILEEKKAPEMVDRMNTLGLLGPLFSNIRWNSEKMAVLKKYYQEEIPAKWFKHEQQRISQTRKNGAYIILTAQSGQVNILKVLNWLRLKNHLAQMVIQANLLCHQLDSLRSLTPSQATKMLEPYSQLEIYCVSFLCNDIHIKKILENFALHWRWIKPKTDGEVLQKRGLKPGPAFSTILSELKAAWIDGKVKSENEEQAYLETLLQKVCD
jgi:tRNA nucleotidyltransferase (CCA-adding enzyme)